MVCSGVLPSESKEAGITIVLSSLFGEAAVVKKEYDTSYLNKFEEEKKTDEPAEATATDDKAMGGEKKKKKKKMDPLLAAMMAK